MGGILHPRYGKPSRGRSKKKVALSATNLQEPAGPFAAVALQEIQIKVGRRLLKFFYVDSTLVTFAKDEIFLAVNPLQVLIGWLGARHQQVAISAANYAIAADGEKVMQSTAPADRTSN
jgi:hypothetical protein